MTFTSPIESVAGGMVLYVEAMISQMAQPMLTRLQHNQTNL